MDPSAETGDAPSRSLNVEQLVHFLSYFDMHHSDENRGEASTVDDAYDHWDPGDDNSMDALERDQKFEKLILSLDDVAYDRLIFKRLTANERFEIAHIMTILSKYSEREAASFIVCYAATHESRLVGAATMILWLRRIAPEVAAERHPETGTHLLDEAVIRQYPFWVMRFLHALYPEAMSHGGGTSPRFLPLHFALVSQGALRRELIEYCIRYYPEGLLVSFPTGPPDMLLPIHYICLFSREEREISLVGHFLPKAYLATLLIRMKESRAERMQQELGFKPEERKDLLPWELAMITNNTPLTSFLERKMQHYLHDLHMNQNVLEIARFYLECCLSTIAPFRKAWNLGIVASEEQWKLLVYPLNYWQETALHLLFQQRVFKPYRWLQGPLSAEMRKAKERLKPGSKEWSGFIDASGNTPLHYGSDAVIHLAKPLLHFFPHLAQRRNHAGRTPWMEVAMQKEDDSSSTLDYMYFLLRRDPMSLNDMVSFA